MSEGNKSHPETSEGSSVICETVAKKLQVTEIAPYVDTGAEISITTISDQPALALSSE